MRPINLLLAATVAAMFTATSLQAQPVSRTSESIAAFIEATALADQISFDIRDHRQVLRQRCQASPECRPMVADLEAVLAEFVGTVRLGPVAVPRIDEMFEHMGDVEGHELIDFYDSPLGQRLVELEVKGRSPELLAQAVSEGEAAYQRQSDERIAMLEAIDSSADRSATQRKLDGLASNIVEWLEEQARNRGFAEVDQGLVSAADSELQDRGRHAHHRRLSLTYEPLSDDELQAYVDFLTGDAGEQWAAVTREIRIEAVRATAAPVVKQLVLRLGVETPPQAP